MGVEVEEELKNYLERLANRAEHDDHRYSSLTDYAMGIKDGQTEMARDILERYFKGK